MSLLRAGSPCLRLTAPPGTTHSSGAHHVVQAAAAAPRRRGLAPPARRQLAPPLAAYADFGQQGSAAQGDEEVRQQQRVIVTETDSDNDTNDGQTLERRLALVANMIKTAELLVPYDRSAVNLGLILWGAIRNIPQKDRVQLLSRLNSGDIMRLWKVAGQRYSAPKQQVAAAIGQDYSLWKDLPFATSDISHFRGKAALPTHVLGISSFSKAFFLQSGSEQLYGRVLLGKGPLGDLLYPLYFKATVGACVVPTTQELCDLRLDYLPPRQLGLAPADLPRSMWPQPRPHLPPFHEGFTDYLRAVAPSVYVGLGYRTASTGHSDPLYFLMVHQRIESLL